MQKIGPEGNPDDRVLPPLSQLDVAVDRLRRQHPGWRIWYVPNATGGHVTWCAQRLPLLNCTSPEDLSEQITSVVEVQAEASWASPPR